ncbi:hypothetical protein GCM10018785_02340 [Streptomyces longispororuber]|uniref:Secreted protein n=1 Tax=Streptomyces longispororuber TaxID=68230 RepID=A0A918Z3M9_9ACTN|nr:hypothetical protein [Streptomyces longispororuber]GHE36153.1 hypothetical protein GCM10018785_02340 [Streptomyces longispororuber]
MVKQIHMMLRAGLVFLAAMIVGIATMASAQAAPTPGKSDVWQVQRTGVKGASAASASALEPAGALARYNCYPPFRYNNAAAWNCTVHSGAIVFWIECSIGGTYTSGEYGPGTYYVQATCPQGRRLSEGHRSVR